MDLLHLAEWASTLLAGFAATILNDYLYEVQCSCNASPNTSQVERFAQGWRAEIMPLLTNKRRTLQSLGF